MNVDEREELAKGLVLDFVSQLLEAKRGGEAPTEEEIDTAVRGVTLLLLQVPGLDGDSIPNLFAGDQIDVWIEELRQLLDQRRNA